MQLTIDEEKGIRGEYGNAIATAYRILVAIGEATSADKLVPIEWAHVSGVNYNTIGDSGLEFLKEISKDGQVKVKTSLNPMGFDRLNTPNLSEEFIQKQFEIVRIYEKMGITPTFSCIPYELMPVPNRGTQVSFAESSAAVLANSHLDLMTNKESALSALASAIVGKVPYSDLRLEEYGLLGYFAGKTVKKSCTGLCSLSKTMDMWKLKSLSAGMGTSGSCGMFKVQDISSNKEKIDYNQKEMKDTFDELNTSEDGQIITFGSPQLGMNELSALSNFIEGRKFTLPCKIFCPKTVYDKAKQIGITSILQNSGAELICDACTCLTPLITKENFDNIVTNSVKAAYYMKTSNKVGVALKDMMTIVKEYCE